MQQNRHKSTYQKNILNLHPKQSQKLFNKITFIAFENINKKCGNLLKSLKITIEDVPKSEIDNSGEFTLDGDVILSKYIAPSFSFKDIKHEEIVLYSFPIIFRSANTQELYNLIFEILTTQIANYLKINKELFN